MFLVVINTIIASIAEILYKKSIAISDIKPTVFQLVGEFFAIPIVAVIMFMGFNLRLLIDPWIIGVFSILATLFVLENNMEQYLYKNEKLSTLLPYTKINNFIVIIAGFVFFRDSSVTSFLICIGSLILATVASIDFKEHSLPKNFGMIVLREIIRAAELMGSVYILKTVSSVEYVVLYQIVYLIGAFLAALALGELVECKKFTPTILKYRGSGYVFGYASYMIDVFLLQEFGIVIATLFGFFGSSLSLALAYFFLREVPEKKEIALGIIMIFLAGLGYYLR